MARLRSPRLCDNVDAGHVEELALEFTSAFVNSQPGGMNSSPKYLGEVAARLIVDDEEVVALFVVGGATEEVR